MESKYQTMIAFIVRQVNSPRYIFAFLLSLIFIAAVYRRETLVARIWGGGNSHVSHVNRRFLKSDDIDYAKIENIVMNKTAMYNQMKKTKLFVKPKAKHDAGMYGERYKNPIPPWERIYYNEEREDRPLLNKERWVKSVDCSKVFEGSRSEIQKTFELENDFLEVLNPFYYIQKTENCENFLYTRQYITKHLSDEESDFPIAYSMVIYKSVYQFERLLRSIYRPQNYYCVHADIKMSDADYDAILGIIKCFKNVFLSSMSFDVRWGTFTVLAADIVCMKDLIIYDDWKYFINLSGQEFPLKTNLEIVKILKSYNGANDVNINLDDGIDWSERWKNAGPPPDDIIPYKGSVHIAVNRDFVQYATSNRTALRFIKWTKGAYIPDETYFSTLNHNPQLGIPGSYKGMIKYKIKYTKGDMVRFKKWNATKDFPCAGMKIHGICIISVEDLPSLAKRPEMFVNKVFWDYDHYALDCLEELIHNRTVDGYYGNTKFNTTVYSNLYFVRHAVK